MGKGENPSRSASPVMASNAASSSRSLSHFPWELTTSSEKNFPFTGEKTNGLILLGNYTLARNHNMMVLSRVVGVGDIRWNDGHTARVEHVLVLMHAQGICLGTGTGHIRGQSLSIKVKT